MEQEKIKMEKTIKQLSKSEVIGSFIGMGNGCEAPAPPAFGGFLCWNWTRASC